MPSDAALVGAPPENGFAVGPTSPEPLRGRDALLSIFRRRLEAVRAGSSSVLVLEGGAGIGKTRALRAAAELAAHAGLQVGVGRAVPGAQTIPMGPLFAALFEGPSPLIGLGERARLRYLPEQRYWLLDELESLFERSALNRPLVLVLDDLQWADSGTLLALRTLPTRLASVPIVWVLAFRSTEISPELRSLIDSLVSDGASRVVLGPLDEPAMGQVIADLTGAGPDSALMQMAALTHGIPFLLIQLIRGLEEEALIRVEADRVRLLEDRLPARIGESMRERLARMPELTRKVARAASVLGRTLTVGQLSAMTGESAVSLLAPVDELLAADVLAESGDRLAFGHDLLREAVRGALPASALRALERQAVDVLLAAGSPAVEIAAQLAASAEPGDYVAVETLQSAASALARSDPDAAADLSRRALELAGPRHPARVALVTQTVLHLHAAGRVREGKAFADDVLRQALTAEQEAEVLLGIANMYGLSADLRAEAGVRALALPDLPDRLRTRHLAYLAHNRTTGGRPEEAAALMPELRAAVKRMGDVPARYALELVESGLHYLKSDFSDACRWIEACVRTSADLAEPSRTVLVQYWCAEVWSVLDRHDDALSLTSGALTAAQNDRQVWGSFLFEGGLGRHLFQVGRLEDAAAALEPAVEVAEHVSQSSVLDAAAAAALGQVALHTGDSARLAQCLAFTEHLRRDGTPAVKRHAAWLSALAAISQGDVGRAHLEALELGGSDRDWMESRLPLDVTDEVNLMRIGLACGDTELADRALTAAQDRARRNPGVATIVGIAAHCQGLRHGDREALDAAVAHLEGCPRPLALASALEDAGRLAMSQGWADLAVDSLSRALRLYADHGASSDAARARGLLRGLGVRRRLNTATRPASGWEGLTESEVAVVRLVARGLTNREVAERLYLSVHTVAAHLRNAFAKLSIKSRVELAHLEALESARQTKPPDPHDSGGLGS
ncbi:ATP-binding protein [Gryllotalpicola protaetiae]|nr:LuxR family transcriptional regulator [Gryllotalpicola protaetiae]